MSIAPISETPSCYYTYDRERSCGGVISYGAHTKTSNTETKSDISTKTQRQESSNQVGFGDLLDIINPLQHLPVISWAYQKITGDTMKPVSAMIGGTLFGGGMGLLASALQEAITDHNIRQDQSTDFAQNPNPIDRLISKIIGPEKMIIASHDTKTTPPLQDIATAILHYSAFDREQTAGSIAVYG